MPNLRLPVKPFIMEKLKFSGDDSDHEGIQFLSNLKTLTEVYSAGWEDIKRILSISLSGTPKMWSDSVGESIINIDVFVEKFGKCMSNRWRLRFESQGQGL